MLDGIEVLGGGDEDRLRAIRLRSLRDSPDAFGSTLQAMMSWPKERWSSQLESLHTLVALHDGRDMGIVRGAPDDGGDLQVRWLISMWVDPQARGLGLGVRLIEQLKTWAIADGARQLKLEVGSYNKPAQALYRRVGFEFTGGRRRVEPPRDHLEELEFALCLEATSV